MKQVLNNQSGFTITGAVLSAGLLLVIVGGTLGLSEIANKMFAGYQSDMDFQQLRTKMAMVATSPSTCTSAFANNQLSVLTPAKGSTPATFTINNLTAVNINGTNYIPGNPSSPNLSNIELGFSDLKLASTEVSGEKNYTGNFTLKARKAASLKSYGSSEYSHSIPIQFIASSADKVVKCANADVIGEIKTGPTPTPTPTILPSYFPSTLSKRAGPMTLPEATEYCRNLNEACEVSYGDDKCDKAHRGWRVPDMAELAQFIGSTDTKGTLLDANLKTRDQLIIAQEGSLKPWYSLPGQMKEYDQLWQKAIEGRYLWTLTLEDFETSSNGRGTKRVVISLSDGELSENSNNGLGRHVVRCVY